MEVKKYQLEPTPRQVTEANLNDDIFLSVSIGNGQTGANKVTIEGKLLARGNLSKPTSIGKVSDLKSREIVVETNVLDVNAMTNMCVITTTFNNQDGRILFSKIDKGEAPENGIASFRGQYAISVLAVLLFIIVLWGCPIFAQNTDGKIEFQNLETPSSPGFILLDKAPSSIEKPSTPQGFGISLLGLFQGAGGAIEFAPFWLTTHSRLTAKEMYENKYPILSTFSVSVATVKNADSTYLTGGFRARAYQRYSSALTQRLDSLTKVLEDLLSKSPEDLDLAKIELVRKKYIEIVEKPVFTIDMAAALGARAMNNSFRSLEFNRWAAWLSLNWRPKGDDFYFTVLSRYINNEQFEEYLNKSDLLDLGARLNYDIERLCISLEYLQRFNMTQDSRADYRIALIGSYRLSDSFFITSTFGKNFTGVNNIIAVAGINFGYSNKKIKAY